ncbi:endonuclease/exonuclease/phosphatase family protein [Patescibacteria group bacterium]|nr:endonuclease/exonuclease/phosphatase family protein [Patescibacteria group bacterium]
MELKILSWNIWIDGHFEDIKAFLASADADIIGLQEVKDDDPERDVIGFLSGLGYAHVFAPAKKSWGGHVYRDGPAVFSRLPVLKSETHLLSERDERAAARADIQAGKRVLHVFSTHLVHTHQKESEVQAAQAEKLLSLLPAADTILMGDFNATPESGTIRRMKETLTDADAQDLPTWSVYPEGCSTCLPQRVDTKLDYIFTTPDLKTRSFRVEESKGSDHLPVSVMVEA